MKKNIISIVLWIIVGLLLLLNYNSELNKISLILTVLAGLLTSIKLTIVENDLKKLQNKEDK